jgi:hypothetical protein
MWPFQYFYPWSLAFWRRNNTQLSFTTHFLYTQLATFSTTCLGHIQPSSDTTLKNNLKKYRTINSQNKAWRLYCVCSRYF